MNFVEVVLIPLLLIGVSLYFGNLLGVRRGRNQMKEEYELEARANREKESEAIRNLKNSISNEVEQNKELLEKGYITNKWGHRKYLYRLFRNAFDNALATEKYNSLSGTTKKTVSTYYSEIDRWNELVNELQGEDKALTLQAIFNQHDALAKKLKKISIDLMEVLKAEES